MKKIINLRLAMGTLGLMLLASGCKQSTPGDAPASSSNDPEQPATIKIAVIPKGTTQEFWKAVHAGAVKAARELAVQIVWKGPLREDDLKGQIELVQSFTAQHVSGIALAPLNDSALRSAVSAAGKDQVPVVIFDSGLKGEDYVSFVATDNLGAGKLAGEAMSKALGGKGKVMLLRYQEGSASTHLREQGFLDAVATHPELEVVSSNQYGGVTTESAFAASESLLLAQSAAKGQVNGVFCPNESTTFGMLLALDKLGLASKLHFIGFDASEKLVSGLEQGKIQGLVLQDPFNMGYLSVKTMVDHLKGVAVPKITDTGSTLITRDNMEEPEMARLLKPELSRFLDEP